MKKKIKIQVVLTEKMHVYHDRSNSGPIFGSVPLILNIHFSLYIFEVLGLCCAVMGK